MRTSDVLVTAIAVALTAASLRAQSWPQWRGPDRDGRTTAVVPATWAAKPTSIWKVPVGIGHASPIVAGGRVYVFARLDEKETLSALDLESGRTLWSQRYEAPYTVNPAAAGHGKGPKSTPVLSGGRVFALGITGVLTACDAASGTVAWRATFEKEFPVTAPDFGTAMSPIVEGDAVIAHVGGPGRGVLRAFDAATGKVRWSWTGDGPGYASPVVLASGGVRQIVTQTQRHIVGVDAASGTTLWTLPFETAYEQNIVTPLVFRDTVILSGLSKGVFAVRPSRQGAAWTTAKVWENADVSMYMSSPVLVGDRVVGFSHRNRGQFFALDAATGGMLWTSPPRQGENAAIVAAGDRMVALTDDGQVTVARVDGTTWTPLAKVEVASSPTWAHPVVLGSRMLVKDEQTLALLRIG
jgi:outer membrane protein assembly factor BamB